jgi:hypothetical protein
MIKLTLTRTHFSEHATIGKLVAEKCVYNPSLDSYIKNGCLEKTSFCCYTLEDAVRGNGDPATVAEWKIPGESAIPYGTYDIKKVISTKRNKEVIGVGYGDKPVPGYRWVQIHVGNGPEDTDGCILVGMSKDELNNHIYNSKKAFDTLMWFVGDESGTLEVRK